LVKGGRQDGGRAKTHEVSSITSDNKGLALGATGHSSQSSLDKILGVVLPDPRVSFISNMLHAHAISNFKVAHLLLEHLDTLSQPRSTGLLAIVDLGLDVFDLMFGPAVS
jgi:hypothetical protein